MCAAPYRRLSVALCVALAVVFGSLPRAEIAYAATFTVATLQDAPHTTPLDGNCTSTLAGNPCTLRAAVQAANFLGGTQAISLQAAGTYLLTVTGTGEDNAATGDLDVNGAILTITNTSAGSIAIDGNVADRVFDVGPVASAQLAISGVTIQRGAITDTPGAGIRVRSGLLTLTDVTVTNNLAAGIFGPGGGISVQSGGGSAILNRVTLSGNVAGSGGGAMLLNGTATLTNVTISGNAGGRGGAIENTSGNLTLVNVTVMNNTGTAGG